MALATLSIDLVAQLASLQQGMDKAGRLAEKQAAEIEARYARMGEAARAVGAALAGAFSVAGLAAFFKTTVDGLDALNDIADATGATIENISALEDVAARTGTQMETVSGALLKLNKVLSEAKPGSEMAQTLESIGLSAEQLRQEDPAEALRQVAEALSGYADNGDKARLVQELFGKSTKEAAAFLKDLAEQGQLNATVTAQQTAEAEKLNKALFEFQKSSTDTARAIAGQLVPALNQLFDAIKGKDTGGQGAISSLITIPLQTATVVASDVAFVMRGIGNEIGGIAAQVVSLAKLDFKGFRNIGAAMKADAEQARKELDAFQARVMAIGTVRDAGGGRGFVLPDQPRPSVPRIAGQPDKSGKVAAAPRELVGPVLDAVRIDALKAIEATDTVKVEKLRAALTDLLAIGRDNPSPAVSQAIQSVIDQIAKLDPAAQAVAASTKRIEAALAATPSARKADARARVDELQAALTQTDDPQRLRQIQEAIDAIYEGIGAIPDVAEPAFAKLDDLTANFAKNVQTTFGDTIFSTLTGNFANIGDAWKNLLLRMVSDALATDLTRALFPASKSGDSGSALGGLFSAITGGLGSLFGGGRATGGGVRAGGIYSVVEQGPELLQVGDKTMLLMGSRNGSVMPASRSDAQGGAAPVQVVQHFTFHGSGNRAEMAAWAVAVQQRTIAAFADAQRRGRSFQGA